MRSVASTTCALLAFAVAATAPGAGARPALLQDSSGTAAAGSWTAPASMSAKRAHLTATRLGNGRILVVGGSGELTTELYDPPTGTWIPGGTLNQARGLHVAVRLLDGRVLVA